MLKKLDMSLQLLFAYLEASKKKRNGKSIRKDSHVQAKSKLNNLISIVLIICRLLLNNAGNKFVS